MSLVTTFSGYALNPPNWCLEPVEGHRCVVSLVMCPEPVEGHSRVVGLVMCPELVEGTVVWWAW
jgi:hypothetical protein